MTQPTPDAADQMKVAAPEVEPDDQGVLGPDDETASPPAELLAARGVAVFVPSLMSAAAFAALALAQVGKLYVLGAEAQVSNASPSRFDCSELVEWLYGRNGTPITDLAAAQYNATKAVSGSPRVGDLVFLRNNPARSNGIGHVAVLTRKLASGDWEIVEARGRAYGVVKTTLSYWKTRRHYAGLRRFPGFKLAAEPVVVLPTLARVATYNCGAWGKTSMTGKQIDAVVGVLLTLSASIYCLTECPEWLRDHIRGVCECPAADHRRMPGGPSRWLVRERGSQAILRDSTKWVSGPYDSDAFGPTDYHGWVWETLTQPVTKARLTVGAYHLPPNVVATQDYQRGRLKTFLARLTSGPRLVGGDGADDPGWAVGWADARYAAKASANRDAPTYKGTAIRDRIQTKGVVVRRYTVIPSAGASDHDAVLAQITVPARGADPTL